MQNHPRTRYGWTIRWYLYSLVLLNAINICGRRIQKEMWLKPSAWNPMECTAPLLHPVSIHDTDHRIWISQCVLGDCGHYGHTWLSTFQMTQWSWTVQYARCRPILAWERGAREVWRWMIELILEHRCKIALMLLRAIELNFKTTANEKSDSRIQPQGKDVFGWGRWHPMNLQ